MDNDKFCPTISYSNQIMDYTKSRTPRQSPISKVAMERTNSQEIIGEPLPGIKKEKNTLISGRMADSRCQGIVQTYTLIIHRKRCFGATVNRSNRFRPIVRQVASKLVQLCHSRPEPLHWFGSKSEAAYAEGFRMIAEKVKIRGFTESFRSG
jgi:hypothetical protein